MLDPQLSELNSVHSNCCKVAGAAVFATTTDLLKQITSSNSNPTDTKTSDIRASGSKLQKQTQ